MIKMCFFSSTVTKPFDFFNCSEEILSVTSFKNFFVLVLAHLEPELELFEVDDIGEWG